MSQKKWTLRANFEENSQIGYIYRMSWRNWPKRRILKKLSKIHRVPRKVETIRISKKTITEHSNWVSQNGNSREKFRMKWSNIYAVSENVNRWNEFPRKSRSILHKVSTNEKQLEKFSTMIITEHLQMFRKTVSPYTNFEENCHI